MNQKAAVQALTCHSIRLHKCRAWAACVRSACQGFANLHFTWMVRCMFSRSVHHTVSCVCLMASRVVQVGTVEQYLEKGPGFIFLFHPALGPMWDVIAQKIRGGALMHGSELVLEVAIQVSQPCSPVVFPMRIFPKSAASCMSPTQLKQPALRGWLALFSHPGQQSAKRFSQMHGTGTTRANAARKHSGF